MAPELAQAIARLRRSQPRNADTMMVCDEVDRLSKAHNATGEAKFDRTVYQRELMRKRRAQGKA